MPAGATRIYLVARSADRTTDMPSVFSELGLSHEVVALEDSSGLSSDGCSLLWIAAPEYPEPAALPAGLVAVAESVLAGGGGVFTEFITNCPGVPARAEMLKSGVARLFVSGRMGIPDELATGTILDEHDSLFLPLSGPANGFQEVLSFARIPGVQRVAATHLPNDTWPGLVLGRRGQGRIAFSTTSLSEFRLRQCAPAAHWERLLRQVVLALLPESVRGQVLKTYLPLRTWTEPRRWVLPGSSFQVRVETSANAQIQIGGSGAQSTWRASRPGTIRIPVTASRAGSMRSTDLAVRVEDRRTAYVRAFERNIRWFERSGALLAPDGSLGVAEMISGPDTNGIRVAHGVEQLMTADRADCVFESALAFWMYGKLAASARHRAIGEAMLSRIMDFQRLETGDPGYGLWNTRGRGGPAFQDDTSWATILSLAGGRYLNKLTFRHRGLISAKAQLKAFGPDDRQRVPLLAKPDARRSMTQRVDQHPHSGGCVLAAWLYTYGVTGERVYLETALPMLDEMIAGFGKIPRYIISRTCESSRFLLPLALAAHYTRLPKYLDALRVQAGYLRSRMAPCGAIQEDGSNTGNSVEGGDLGLTHDANETVSDQLYTTSFAAMNFWIAWKATGDAQYRDDFFRVADFLVRIQIESTDRMLDGGWMRAFDYSLWDYYGSNADQAWNAYSMETGWQNAIIDIAIGLYLMDDPFFQPARSE